MSTATSKPASGATRVKPDVNRLRASLNAPVPNQAGEAVKPGETYDEAFQRLPVMQIRPYDNNPRVRANPSYRELKESIRSTQAKNVVLTITKRPGDAQYMCAAGGNTTLTAVQDLWQETKDPVFETVKTLFTKWTGEINVIIAHLSENENRSDICFWDKANAIVDLKARVEQERAESFIPIERFIQLMAEGGLNSNTTTVRAYFFATEQLRPIGQWLTLPATKAIQPRLNQIRRLGQSLGVPLRELDELVQQTLEKQAIALQDTETANPQTEVSVDAAATCAALEHAFAAKVGISIEELAAMVGAAQNAGGQNLTGAALREAAKVATATAPVAAPPTKSHPRAPSASPHRQMPLQPAMLAPLQGNNEGGSQPVAAGASRSEATPAGAGQTLAPLHSSSVQVRGSGAEGDTPDASGTFRDPAWLTLRQTGPADDPAHPDHAPGTVLAVVRDIVIACGLQELVFVAPAMPLGYYCELPAVPFSNEFVVPPSADVEDPEWSSKRAAALKRSGWQMLAALSGQCDAQIYRKLPLESHWRRAADGGRLGQVFESLGMGSDDPARGGMQIGVVDIYRFLYSPELGELFLQLWSWVQRWIQHDPDRFPFEVFPAR